MTNGPPPPSPGDTPPCGGVDGVLFGLVREDLEAKENLANAG
jgi:hypothetical protein